MECVLDRIIDGLNSWTEKILDIEEKIKNSSDLRQSVLDSLNRQLLDGLISEQDSIELGYTSSLWFDLYRSCLCKTAGANFADRDALTYLLELYTLKQITKDFFINATLEICRGAN